MAAGKPHLVPDPVAEGCLKIGRHPAVGAVVVDELAEHVVGAGVDPEFGRPIVEPEKFGEVMAIDLAGYPADILKEAVGHARRTLDWFPSIKEMIAICERLIEPRRNQYRAIWQMKAEHRRRRQETAERKAEAGLKGESEMEREAHRQRLRDLEVQARERLGDDAPLPGDLEL